MVRLALFTTMLFACSDRAASSRSTTPVDVKPTSAAQPTPPAEDPAIARAREFVALLAAGKHADAAATFDATMAAMMPEPKLASTWSEIVAHIGAFEAIERAQLERTTSHTVVVLTCKFAGARFYTKLAYDGAGKVAGLFFTPVAEPSADRSYTDPPYVDRGKLVEREVTVGSGEWALPGTLTLPRGAGPFRAVVIVHGSGPVDRDGTVGANRPYKDLAGGLATRGIAVLRYDKRTRVHGAKFAAMDEATLEHETIADALAAVELLRGMKEIDPAHVVVAGHSLGGYAAPRIAKRSPHLAGIAVLAGNTRPVSELYIEQLERLASTDERLAAATAGELEQAKAAAVRIRELQRGATAKPGERVLGTSAAYWIDLRGYDPPAVAKQIVQPILVAQGGRDIQVTEVDYKAWQAALRGRKQVTFKLYPELNHRFGVGEVKSSPAEHEQRAPVDVRLVDDLAAWIRSL